VEQEKVKQLAGTRETIHIQPQSAENSICFAVIGDTQFGSLYSAADHLSAFYDSAKAAGATCVLHAGDVLDGWKVYKGQEFELGAVGFEAQLEELAEKAKLGEFKEEASVRISPAIEAELTGDTSSAIPETSYEEI
jgi:DNA polymerase II small subunit/DNA polymerase delta subunit B